MSIGDIELALGRNHHEFTRKWLDRDGGEGCGFVRRG
jgi:hypothetical protein